MKHGRDSESGIYMFHNLATTTARAIENREDELITLPEGLRALLMNKRSGNTYKQKNYTNPSIDN